MNFPLLPKRAAKVALFSFLPNFFRDFLQKFLKKSKETVATSQYSNLINTKPPEKPPYCTRALRLLLYRNIQ